MTDLVLLARDGFTVKDPRGFRVGSERAESLTFPLPSTVSGAVRTAVGLTNGWSTAKDGPDAQRWAGLLDLPVSGPIVVARSLTANARFVPWWPAPADALPLWLPTRPGTRDLREIRYQHVPATPRSPGESSGAGLVAGGPADELLALSHLDVPTPPDQSKPAPGEGLFDHDTFLGWLRRPGEVSAGRVLPIPVREDTRVAIDPESGAHKEGALFSHGTTETLLGKPRRPPAASVEIGLAVRVAAETPPGLAERPEVWRLGGEGRRGGVEALDWEQVLGFPRALENTWDAARAFRLVLVTPGRFEAGWRPDWLRIEVIEGRPRFVGTPPGLDFEVALRAAWVPRAVPASGWSLAAPSPGPKASHRLVPAGTVYAFEVIRAEALCSVVDAKKLWLGTLQTPGTQAHRDGYGLIVPGRIKL